MSGSNIALDTSAAVAFLNDEPAMREKLIQFDHFHISAPALGELFFGTWNSEQLARNQRKLEFFVGDCHVLDITAATARVYAQIRLDLKRRGKPIPENDLWIAAACLEHGLPLATRDAHFTHVSGLDIVNP
ncbi:MAG: type II toxin-antitoxin system VapC family toxin [Phycisphaerae bacterium]